MSLQNKDIVIPANVRNMIYDHSLALDKGEQDACVGVDEVIDFIVDATALNNPDKFPELTVIQSLLEIGYRICYQSYNLATVDGKDGWEGI